jgi:pimeloyl-ACP methyl ester carboxylesterase
MKSFLRFTGLTGAILVLALLIAIPVSASAGHDQYNGIIPLSEIYEKLGVSFHGRHGCPSPKDFELLLELEVNDVAADPVSGLPEFTQVKGTLYPETKFELRLPLDNEWNGKFYMTGCGGFCGGVDIFPVGQFTNNLNWGLVRGYASATSDSGHSNIVDGTSKGRTYADWALDNRSGEVDWAFRAIHEVTRVSKALICAFYQKRPKYSYFAGCSTGGRMAVVAANRYPKDFDGVISGAPALNYTGLVATWMSWVVQAVGTNVFTATDQAVIEQAVLDQCDALDGAEDGLISDPRLCPAIDFGALGFTGDKLAALNQLFSRPTNSAGDVLYEGMYPYGSEFYWPIWLPGADPTVLNPYAVHLIVPFNDGFVKYMAFEVDDPTFTAFDFNFDTDPARLEYMGRIYNATKNLDAFQKAGGKLLMYHGWADSIVPPFYSQYFYNRVADAMGGVKRIQKFFRLFMIPGMDHCSTAQSLEPIGLGTSIGLDDFDALTALEMWVERDRAPDSMEASGHTRDGDPISQTLYPYRFDEFPGKGKKGRR